MASRKRTVVSDSASQFSLDIYKAITRSANNDNLFIAPTSIWIAMAMVNVGARNATREQIAAALKLRLKDEEVMLDEFEKFLKVLNRGNRKSVKLQVANRLYPDSGRAILPMYISTISQHFGTDVKPLDFVSCPDESRILINKWVEEVTEQKIKNLLPDGSINSLTRLAIVNAIYFKGNWAMPFKRRNTRDRDFHLIDGGIVQVPMMTIVQEDVKYGENSELGCKVLHLPYEGDGLAMVIILPTEIDGLLELETRLDSQALLKIIDDVFSRRVEVYLPKFKLESSLALSKTMSALGMVDAFSEDKADLSGMGTNLYVSNVFHKAFVDVNEKGSEAAAATAALERDRCPPPRPRKFKADHPFLFLIWDFKLRAPLFIGRYMHPPSQSSSTHS